MKFLSFSFLLLVFVVIHSFKEKKKKMVQELTDESEFNSTLSSHSVVVAYYFASWSTPCRAIAPKFDEISEQHPSGSFVKIDVDELSEVAETWGVNCMPTFIVYKDGQVSQKIEGADFDRLRKAIGELVSDEEDRVVNNTNNVNAQQFGDTANFQNDQNTEDDDEEEDDEDDEEFQPSSNENRK